MQPHTAQKTFSRSTKSKYRRSVTTRPRRSSTGSQQPTVASNHSFTTSLKARSTLPAVAANPRSTAAPSQHVPGRGRTVFQHVAGLAASARSTEAPSRRRHRNTDGHNIGSQHGGTIAAPARARRRGRNIGSQHGVAVAAPARSKVPAMVLHPRSNGRSGVREGARSSRHHSVACVAAARSTVGGTNCVAASRSAGDGGRWPHPIRLGAALTLLEKEVSRRKPRQMREWGSDSR